MAISNSFNCKDNVFLRALSSVLTRQRMGYSASRLDKTTVRSLGFPTTS
ncbi:MAG: hypothetical protein HC772_10865 [Leptolyngbyaceae cyanobacterium CRU_2_3]|nr:hypothetical protein [Leptolyngbyaceae cyanobacterium CRU_2_3]